jgi:membrane protein DedA with SNARE-associated domain
MWLETILPSVVSYIPLLCFFGSWFGGEAAIIILSVFSSQGYYNIFLIFLFCYFGSMAGDIFWFFMGRAKFLSKLKKKRIVHKRYLRVRNTIDRLVGRNHVMLIITMKFVYGFRVLMLMYLGRRMKFKRFILFDSMVSFVWIALITLVGWFAGKGIGWILKTYHSLQLVVLVLFCACLTFYIFKVVLGRVVSKRISG